MTQQAVCEAEPPAEASEALRGGLSHQDRQSGATTTLRQPPLVGATADQHRPRCRSSVGLPRAFSNQQRYRGDVHRRHRHSRLRRRIGRTSHQHALRGTPIPRHKVGELRTLLTGHGVPRRNVRHLLGARHPEGPHRARRYPPRDHLHRQPGGDPLNPRAS